MASRFEREGWTFPEPVKFSEGFTALEPHITFDNLRIFWAWRGMKDKDMYMAQRTSNGWSEAEYVGPGMMVSSSRDGLMYVTDTQFEPNQIVNVRIKNGRFTQYKRLAGGMEQFQNGNRTAHPYISPDGSYVISDKKCTNMVL